MAAVRVVFISSVPAARVGVVELAWLTALVIAYWVDVTFIAVLHLRYFYWSFSPGGVMRKKAFPAPYQGKAAHFRENLNGTAYFIG
jgi:hypothetical protein